MREKQSKADKTVDQKLDFPKLLSEARDEALEKNSFNVSAWLQGKGYPENLIDKQKFDEKNMGGILVPTPPSKNLRIFSNDVLYDKIQFKNVTFIKTRLSFTTWKDSSFCETDITHASGLNPARLAKAKDLSGLDIKHSCDLVNFVIRDQARTFKNLSQNSNVGEDFNEHLKKYSMLYDKYLLEAEEEKKIHVASQELDEAINFIQSTYLGSDKKVLPSLLEEVEAVSYNSDDMHASGNVSDKHKDLTLILARLLIKMDPDKDCSTFFAPIHPTSQLLRGDYYALSVILCRLCPGSDAFTFTQEYEQVVAHLFELQFNLYRCACSSIGLKINQLIKVIGTTASRLTNESLAKEILVKSWQFFENTVGICDGVSLLYRTCQDNDRAECIVDYVILLTDDAASEQKTKMVIKLFPQITYLLVRSVALCNDQELLKHQNNENSLFNYFANKSIHRISINPSFTETLEKYDLTLNQMVEDILYKDKNITQACYKYIELNNFVGPHQKRVIKLIGELLRQKIARDFYRNGFKHKLETMNSNLEETMIDKQSETQLDIYKRELEEFAFMKTKKELVAFDIDISKIPQGWSLLVKNCENSNLLQKQTINNNNNITYKNDEDENMFTFLKSVISARNEVILCMLKREQKQLELVKMYSTDTTLHCIKNLSFLEKAVEETSNDLTKKYLRSVIDFGGHVDSTCKEIHEIVLGDLSLDLIKSRFRDIYQAIDSFLEKVRDYTINEVTREDIKVLLCDIREYFDTWKLKLFPRIHSVANKCQNENEQLKAYLNQAEKLQAESSWSKFLKEVKCHYEEAGYRSRTCFISYAWPLDLEFLNRFIQDLQEKLNNPDHNYPPDNRETLKQFLEELRSLLSNDKTSLDHLQKVFKSFSTTTYDSQSQEICIKQLRNYISQFCQEQSLQPFLRHLRDNLLMAGIKVYLDIEDNDFGNNIYSFMEKANHSDFVLLFGTKTLLTKHQNGCKAVCTELIEIERKRKKDIREQLGARVFPIILTGSPEESFPPYFERYSTIRDWQRGEYASNVQDLLRALYGASRNNLDYKRLCKIYTPRHQNANLSDSSIQLPKSINNNNNNSFEQSAFQNPFNFPRQTTVKQNREPNSGDVLNVDIGGQNLSPANHHG